MEAAEKAAWDNRFDEMADELQTKERWVADVTGEAAQPLMRKTELRALMAAMFIAGDLANPATSARRYVRDVDEEIDVNLAAEDAADLLRETAAVEAIGH